MHITYMVLAMICKLGAHKLWELDVIPPLIWDEIERNVIKKKVNKTIIYRKLWISRIDQGGVYIPICFGTSPSSR